VDGDAPGEPEPHAAGRELLRVGGEPSANHSWFRMTGVLGPKKSSYRHAKEQVDLRVISTEVRFDALTSAQVMRPVDPGHLGSDWLIQGTPRPPHVMLGQFRWVESG